MSHCTSRHCADELVIAEPPAAFQLGYGREVRENLTFISGLYLLSLSLRTILSVEVDFQSSQPQSQFRALSTLDSNYTFRQLP